MADDSSPEVAVQIFILLKEIDDKLVHTSNTTREIGQMVRETSQTVQEISQMVQQTSQTVREISYALNGAHPMRAANVQ